MLSYSSLNIEGNSVLDIVTNVCRYVLSSMTFVHLVKKYLLKYSNTCKSFRFGAWIVIRSMIPNICVSSSLRLLNA